MLLALTDNLFASKQFHILIKLISEEIHGYEYDSVVLSANKGISNNKVVFVISFTYRINNSGPKIDP